VRITRVYYRSSIDTYESYRDDELTKEIRGRNISMAASNYRDPISDQSSRKTVG
jgi:hypothetical protein